MEYVVLACRCVLCVVFFVASFGKLRRRSAFADFVATVKTVVPTAVRFGRPVAISVVAGETAIALAMVSALTAPFGFALAIILLSMFVIGIWRAIRRGAHTPCRCFGTSDVPIGFRHIVRNTALITVAVVGMAGVTARPEILPPPAGVLLSLTAGLLLGTLLIRFDEFVDVFSTS